MPLSPEWANLPKRHCDDCNKLYKPVRPNREGEKHFCSDNCRKSYHKHGGAYRKLKAEMVKMVERQMKEFNGQAEILIRHMVRQEFERIAGETRVQLLAAIPPAAQAYYGKEVEAPITRRVR